MASRNHKLRASTERQPPNRIAELRRARNLSQTQLGHLCHTAKSTIARWESGETGIDIAGLRLVARALDAKPSELLLAEDVEIRLAEQARSALTGLSSDELGVVMEAAASIGKLVKRLSPNKGSTKLLGDTRVAARLADIWNELNSTDQVRVLGLVETAREFGHRPSSIAAE